MRQIGTIASEADAKRLADYLLTLGITSRLDQAKDGWAVWVHDEERVAQARRELQAFVSDPADPRFRGVEQEARALRRKAEEAQREHARQSIRMEGRQNFRPAARCPLTYGLIAACVAVALLTNLGRSSGALEAKLRISEARQVIQVVQDEQGRPHFGESTIESNGFTPIRRGEVWRLWTPIFLHFGILHLLFNLFCLYDLGGLVELRRGTWRLAWLVLLIAPVSNVAQFLASADLASGPGHTGNPLFGGMSGVVYGLLGYVWLRGHYDPEGDLVVRQGTVTLMLGWMLLGMMGVIPNVANGAHVGGLVMGMVLGFLPHLGEQVRSWLRRA